MLSPIEDDVRRAFPGQLGLLWFASLRGLLGKARGGLATEPAEFAAAEANLLEAHATFAKLRGDKDKEAREWAQGLVDLYTAWDRAVPGQGYDVKAVTWNARLKDTAPRPPEAK